MGALALFPIRIRPVFRAHRPWSGARSDLFSALTRKGKRTRDELDHAFTPK
jgi:hypothetical protein